MNQDGVKKGYHVSLLQKVKATLTIPVIASGGAGKMQHFFEVFKNACIDGALAASVFHSGEIIIQRLECS